MKRFEIINGKCVIPEGTDNIKDYEFYCSAGAFAECPYLWSVNIPAGVTCIEDGTFFGCQMLSKFSLPDSVTEIRRYAFCGCRNLEGLKIPASVHTIGSYAFSECGRREETKIPLTVRMLGHDVASVYVSEEIDDEDHLEEVKREEECDVKPCGGGDELLFNQQKLS